jgi:predicted nucleic acid-binding protein
MKSFTVVLDACVLVPVTAADTLLRLAEREMYRPVWSERILEEAKRAIARLHPELSAAQIDHRFGSMNKAFEDASVSGWVSLEGSIVLPDEDDRHVVACALAAGADAIVTNGRRTTTSGEGGPGRGVSFQPLERGQFSTGVDIGLRSAEVATWYELAGDSRDAAEGPGGAFGTLPACG